MHKLLRLATTALELAECLGFRIEGFFLHGQQRHSHVSQQDIFFEGDLQRTRHLAEENSIRLQVLWLVNRVF